MAREYFDLNKLDIVIGRIKPKTYTELVVYSPAHSSERTRVYFNFQACSALGAIAARLSSEFVNWTASKERSTALGMLIPIRGWMRHLSETVKVEDGDASTWQSEKWHLETAEWWLSIRSDPDLADTTKNQYRAAVKSFVAHAQSAGILPHFRFLKGIENAKGGKKPSLAAVKRASTENHGSHFWNDQVAEALDELDLLNDLSDSAQVMRRMDLLLNATRALAERSIRHFWPDWQEVRSIVASGIFDPAGFMKRHCISREPLRLRRGWKRELTEDTDMVALIEHLYDGVIPIKETKNPLLRWIYNLSSIGHIRDLLHSTPDSVIPFLVTMLLDQPIEVSYAANLSISSMSDTANPSNKRVTYIKKRARHRTITIVWATGDDQALELKSKRRIEPATAFRCLMEMRKPLVQFAETHDQDKLFLVLGHGGTKDTVKTLPARTLIDAWDRLRASDAILSRYRFTLDKLRPTLILRAFIVSGGDIFEAFRVANHKSLMTTQRYVNEQVSEKVSANDARNVQTAMSLRMTKSRPDLRESVRLSERDAQQTLQQAVNLGFLGYSMNPEFAQEELRSEIAEFFATGEIVVIEDPEVAAELTAFKAHLTEELPSLRTDPEFETTWLPLLVFINAALEAMTPDIRQQGRRLASEMNIEYLDPPLG